MFTFRRVLSAAALATTLLVGPAVANTLTEVTKIADCPTIADHKQEARFCVASVLNHGTFRKGQYEKTREERAAAKKAASDKRSAELKKYIEECSKWYRYCGPSGSGSSSRVRRYSIRCSSSTTTYRSGNTTTTSSYSSCY